MQVTGKVLASNKIHIHMQVTGKVLICFRSEKTGVETPMLVQKNLHLYESADVMAQLLAGNMSYRPSAMYLEYTNAGLDAAQALRTELAAALATPVSGRAMGRVWFNSIDGSNGQDWLRVPIITNAMISQVPNPSDYYSSNGATFNTTSAAPETMAGESTAHNPFSFAAGSIIYAVSLVAAPQFNNSQLDKVFSRMVLTAPLALQTGQQFSVYWLQSFN